MINTNSFTVWDITIQLPTHKYTNIWGILTCVFPFVMFGSYHTTTSCNASGSVGKWRHRNIVNGITYNIVSETKTISSPPWSLRTCHEWRKAKKNTATRRACHRTSLFTHWGRVTHICVGKQTIIGSYNGLSPVRRHYLNQCWNIVNWTLRNKLQWNNNRNSNRKYKDYVYGKC